MENSINYFGYGANADPKRIEEIIGHEPKIKFGGIANGFKLCLQTLDQIPEPARGILGPAWGSDFLAYTLIKGIGFVSGCLWQISPLDFEKIKEWEEMGGWRKFIPLNVTLYNSAEISAITDVISSENQPLFGAVDGVIYPYRLNESKPKTTAYLEEEKDRMAKIEEVRQKIRMLVK